MGVSVRILTLMSRKSNGSGVEILPEQLVQR